MYNVQETFISKALSGAAMFDEIDDYVDAWHDGDEAESLPEFLGMTAEEYDLWVHCPDAIGLIVSARQQLRSLVDAANDNFEVLKVAARASETSEIAALKAWLNDIGKVFQ